MKNVLNVLLAIFGLLAIVATVAVVIDRIVYHNGRKAGYLDCECEDDEEAAILFYGWFFVPFYLSF